jgi:hypothetical protein
MVEMRQMLVLVLLQMLSLGLEQGELIPLHARPLQTVEEEAEEAQRVQVTVEQVVEVAGMLPLAPMEVQVKVRQGKEDWNKVILLSPQSVEVVEVADVVNQIRITVVTVVQEDVDLGSVLSLRRGLLLNQRGQYHSQERMVGMLVGPHQVKVVVEVVADVVDPFWSSQNTWI